MVGDLEVMGGGPARTTVVAAVPFKRGVREFLAAQLGDRFELVDIREAGDHADVVLCPPCSPQAIGRLRSAFPAARVVVMELHDLEHGIDIGGPVGRVLDAGAAAYYIAPSAAALGEFLTVLDERERSRGAKPAEQPGSLGEVAASFELPSGTALDDAIIRHVDAAVARRSQSGRQS